MGGCTRATNVIRSGGCYRCTFSKTWCNANNNYTLESKNSYWQNTNIAIGKSHYDLVYLKG